MSSRKFEALPASNLIDPPLLVLFDVTRGVHGEDYIHIPAGMQEHISRAVVVHAAID